MLALRHPEPPHVGKSQGTDAKPEAQGVDDRLFSLCGPSGLIGPVPPAALVTHERRPDFAHHFATDQMARTRDHRGPRRRGEPSRPPGPRRATPPGPVPTRRAPARPHSVHWRKGAMYEALAVSFTAFTRTPRITGLACRYSSEPCRRRSSSMRLSETSPARCRARPDPVGQRGAGRSLPRGRGKGAPVSTRASMWVPYFGADLVASPLVASPLVASPQLRRP